MNNQGCCSLPSHHGYLGKGAARLIKRVAPYHYFMPRLVLQTHIYTLLARNEPQKQGKKTPLDANEILNGLVPKYNQISLI